MRAAFHDTGATAGALPPFPGLGGGQRRILRFFARTGPWGEYGRRFERTLRELGLPGTRAALRACAGVTAGMPVRSGPATTRGREQGPPKPSADSSLGRHPGPGTGPGRRSAVVTLPG